LPGWKLILAGGSTSEAWVQELARLGSGTPIEFAINATHEFLCELYAKSTIYWHAAGYGVDEHKNPELTEHFGISIVEAVSAGCIPIVVPSGGQVEIVSSDDLHWTTKEELIEKTLAVINNPSRADYLKDIMINDYTDTAFAADLGKLVI